MQDTTQQNDKQQSFITIEGVTVREIGKPNIQLLAKKLIEIDGLLKRDDIKIR